MLAAISVSADGPMVNYKWGNIFKHALCNMKTNKQKTERKFSLEPCFQATFAIPMRFRVK